MCEDLSSHHIFTSLSVQENKAIQATCFTLGESHAMQIEYVNIHKLNSLQVKNIL